MNASARDHDLSDWLRLSLEPHLGVHAYALLAAFGMPQTIFAQPLARLLTVIPPPLAAILSRPATHDIARGIAATHAWLAHDDHHLVTLADAAYPRALLTLPDPPLLLYVRGQPQALQHPALAVVGARNATADGMDNARAFANHLARSRWCVVSGCAQGIDAAAHAGALDAGSAGAGTVAVLGTGVDRTYPARHRGLADTIAGHGALISELPLGAGPRKHHFPRRNRIIAGLAQGVLVVEAAVHSGSLITARLAADAGREVFAIPGSIHSPLSRGCHALIRQGAKLVETAEDILEELRHLGPQDAVTSASSDAATQEHSSNAHHATPRGAVQAASIDPLLAVLGFDPVSIDTLAARSGLDAAHLSAALITLELAGEIHALPGDRYQRRARH